MMKERREISKWGNVIMWILDLIWSSIQIKSIHIIFLLIKGILLFNVCDDGDYPCFLGVSLLLLLFFNL